MKPKGNRRLFATAVLATAAALFLPLPSLKPSLSILDNLKYLSVPSVLTWFLAAAGFWAFRIRFWSNDARESRRFSSGVLLVVLQAIFLRTIFEVAAAWGPVDLTWLPWEPWVWVPWFLIPGLTGLLLDARFGVLLGLTGSLMLYLLAEPGPWPLAGCTISAVIGVLLLRRSPTRSRVLRAGTVSGGILGCVAACHFALQTASVATIAAAALIPFVIGFISAFLVLAILPLLEWMLGELSDVSVIEYGTDHPLLDELRAKAPGTWYHSLNVADLAEKAAAQVGARALFCRTAALYHDIGKLKEPAIFSENNDGPSPHDTLAPEVSARKIIEHVPYGLELARKHRLPAPFREIIAEHHGISIVRFFYAKACQLQAKGAGSTVDRALFAYPGPPPSTRESGIIALADTVEAASRSFTSRAEPDLRAFVWQLFSERIADGELAQCPLTLADLDKIQAAFVGWLKGRNQYRPAYPAATPEIARAAQAQTHQAA